MKFSWVGALKRISSVYIPAVEVAGRFWKVFDLAYTSYKILENASKMLHALPNECSMEVFRKLFDAL